MFIGKETNLNLIENSSVLAIENNEIPNNLQEQLKEPIIEAVKTLLLNVGEEPEREGLLKTPKRVAEAMCVLTSGYSQSLEALINGAVFDEGHNEIFPSFRLTVAIWSGQSPLHLPKYTQKTLFI